MSVIAKVWGSWQAACRVDHWGSPPHASCSLCPKGPRLENSVHVIYSPGAQCWVRTAELLCELVRATPGLGPSGPEGG